MKPFSEYKKAALNALRNHWPAALVASFVLSLLGASGNEVELFDFRTNVEVDLETYLNTLKSSDIGPFISIFVVVFAAFSFVVALISLAIGGALKMGHCTFNLNLIDNNNPQAKDVLSQLPRFVDGFCMQFLTGLYILLWSLLFIIPGVIKSFAYRMTPFIMAENPYIKPSQAIEQSKIMMDGHKMDFFCLHLSFFGWYFLAGIPSSLAASIITANIMGPAKPFTLLLIFPLLLASFAAAVALKAYTSAANAAFYRDLSALNSGIATEQYNDYNLQQ